MIRSTLLTVVLMLVFTCLVSCSGGNGTLTSPSQNEKAAVSEPTSSTACVGLWQFTADEATGSVGLVQLRTADKMLNVLGFMEPPPLTLMDLDWPNLNIDFVNNKIDVGVKLTHPMGANSTFTGFDVRGVCFGPMVTNADGLTMAMVPAFFSGVPFGYQDGLLGTPDSIGDFWRLGEYKYYCDGLGADTDLPTFFSNPANLANRGKFSGTSPHQRNYHLDWNGVDVLQGFLVFNYAIYANYDFPIPDGSSLDNFPATANSAEAFCAKVTEIDNSLYYAGGPVGGGAISLDVEIWDWQNNIVGSSLESRYAGLIDKHGATSSEAGTTAFSRIYHFVDVPGNPQWGGSMDLVILALDPVTFGEAWFLGLLPPTHLLYGGATYTYFSHTVAVSNCLPAAVLAINPNVGWPGQTITSASITGTFLNGGSLAARLTKTGQSDIIGTGVTFVSGTKITVDFNLTGAVSGFWNVVVTNGCGIDGSLISGFEVKSCASLACPSGSPTTLFGSINLSNWPPQPVRATNQKVIAPLNGYSFCTIDVYGSVYSDGTSNNPTYTIYETCITSTDKVIYQDGRSYSQLYSAQYGSGGFTAVGGSYGTAIPAGYSIHRLTIDGDDFPIALCRNNSNSTQMRVYDWNGSTWGAGVDVPASIMTEAGDYTRVEDFAYDKNTGYYYLTERFSNHGVYAFNASGLVWQDTNIWAPGPTSGNWETGIFIDPGSPDCRLICMSGINESYNTTYWARFNPVGGGKTTSTTSGGTAGATFSIFQGEGCIQYSTTYGYRFLAATYGGNVWSSIPITNW